MAGSEIAQSTASPGGSLLTHHALSADPILFRVGRPRMIDVNDIHGVKAR